MDDKLKTFMKGSSDVGYEGTALQWTAECDDLCEKILGLPMARVVGAYPLYIKKKPLVWFSSNPLRPHLHYFRGRSYIRLQRLQIRLPVTRAPIVAYCLFWINICHANTAMAFHFLSLPRLTLTQPWVVINTDNHSRGYQGWRVQWHVLPLLCVDSILDIHTVYALLCLSLSQCLHMLRSACLKQWRYVWKHPWLFNIWARNTPVHVSSLTMVSDLL